MLSEDKTPDDEARFMAAERDNDEQSDWSASLGMVVMMMMIMMMKEKENQIE